MPTYITCSLVLVHGFGGDFIDTWTYKDVERSVFWPKDLLLSEQKQPRTRILSFGYDAGELVVASIRVYARTMLGFLKDQREGIESRPIVFLGHCLGGLIVKQVSSVDIGAAECIMMHRVVLRSFLISYIHNFDR